MDVSSFLKKLKQQSSLGAELPKSVEPASDGTTNYLDSSTADGPAPLFNTQSSSSSADDEDDTVDDDTITGGDSGNGLRERDLISHGGSERLRRKQSALYTKKLASQRTDLEQPALKLLATNADGGAPSGAASQRDAGRQAAAMRQRMLAQGNAKRPRSSTIDAIRNQLIQERRRLERASERVPSDDAPSLTRTEAIHVPLSTGDNVALSESSTQKLDLVDIDRLLDDGHTVLTSVLPLAVPSSTRTNKPDEVVTEQQLTPVPGIAATPVATVSVDTAPTTTTPTTNGTGSTGRGKKMSRFALAQQLAQQESSGNAKEAEALHYQQF